jgi:tyrosyl-tRNA synthetase
MAAFQRAGHLGVLIVGDYTTRIGDPSGRSAARPILSPEEIDENAKRFVGQASSIIDPDRTEVRFNGEWLAGLDFAEILKLTRTTTVAQILERDDFAKRHRARAPISVSELLYPLMQAYDSVAVEADIELGGTDQLFNLLTGREVMAAYGLEPQVALTVAYLDSWDGSGMSASRGNYIGLAEPPEEQFGKAMRIPDELLPQWYRLVMETEADPSAAGDPMEAKLELARFIVRRAHGEEAVTRAEDHFTRVVREGQAPDEIDDVPLGKSRVAREGSDVTVASYAKTLHDALDAASLLEGEGVSVEVVDLRSLVPLDRDGLRESLQKTGRLVIAHEAPRRAGFGAEIAALVGEEFWDLLEGPIVRVCGENTPVPYAPELENFVLPGSDHIARAIRGMTGFGEK